MKKKILVAYATKHGSTAEIAERIGEVLREKGLPVDVMTVEEVPALVPFSAVVLGSAVYAGRWRSEAVRFLEENEQALAELPVWIFSSGPAGEGDPVEILNGWGFPPAQEDVAERIGPRDVTLFHGKLDLDTLNFIEKWMIKSVEAPVGDFRDWEVITQWAETIAADLLPAVSTTQNEALQKQ